MLKSEADALADVIGRCGTSEFGTAMDRLTRLVAPFDMSCVFSFSERQGALLLHDGYSKTVSRSAVRSYLKGGYLLDPFYVACISGEACGLWRMNDLAPDYFHSSAFAVSKDIHPCISDRAGSLVEEIGYVVSLDAEHSAVYSLMRNQSGNSFGPSEFDALSNLMPVFEAALRQHWHAVSQQETKEAAHRVEAERVFLHAFGSVLTPAQIQVTKLILRGHGNDSIAGVMNITSGTAKMHRYNIYKRLNISSQSELYQKFIAQLSPTDKV